MPSRTKVLKDWSEGRQEPLSITGQFESLHATFALTRRPVRVLTAVVEIAALAQPFQYGHLFARSLAVETCSPFSEGVRSGGFFWSCM